MNSPELLLYRQNPCVIISKFGQEEVEMEDVIAEDHIMDIDSCDAKNPLAVVEYVDEIYDYYRKMEVC